MHAPWLLKSHDFGKWIDYPLFGVPDLASPTSTARSPLSLIAHFELLALVVSARSQKTGK
jgi:hypothetical protein